MSAPNALRPAVTRSLPVIGGAAVLLSLWTAPITRAAGMSEMRLTGTIRDFRQSHVDFEVTPLGGYGHYAGNVLLAPSEDHRPVFSGTGFKVWNEWMDKDRHHIAPHQYLATGTDSCGQAINDRLGSAGARSTGGIDSAASFNEWFRDVPGVNVSSAHAITLTRDGAGVWSYLDDSFHPIDDRLLGNESQDHNNYFTYAFRAEFVYRECWQQFIEFEGGDGVWMFINGVLVTDLGGVGAVGPQRIALDRLALTDGQPYSLTFCYAQRQSSTSVFRLRTTVDLSTENYTPVVSAMFD